MAEAEPPALETYRTRRRYFSESVSLPPSYGFLSLFGEEAVEQVRALYSKELELFDAGRLGEYRAICQDGFSEDSIEKILGLYDHEQAEILSCVNRLNKLLPLTYPSRAGAWLEGERVELHGLSALDVLIGPDVELKHRLDELLSWVESFEAAIEESSS